MWYGAHLLIASESLDANNPLLVVEEPIYLIEAKNLKDSESKARDIASKVAASKVSFVHSGPSKNVSYGFRRIVEISNSDLGNNTPPSDGSEISFEIYKFKNHADFESYRSNSSINAEIFSPESVTLQSTKI